MSEDEWTPEQQTVVRNCRSQLILWGDDLSYGQIEAYLARSTSLNRSVIEVLTSLGAIIALAPLHTIIDRVEQSQLGPEDSLETALYQANEVLIVSNETDSDDGDTASIAYDPGSEDPSELNSRENWVQDLEHYTRLLFQLAPALQAVSEEVPVSEPLFDRIEISASVLNAAARSFTDQFRKEGEFLESIGPSTMSQHYKKEKGFLKNAALSITSQHHEKEEGDMFEEDDKTDTSLSVFSDPPESTTSQSSRYNQPGKSTWTRVSEENVLPQTLDHFGLDWHFFRAPGPEDYRHIVIKEAVGKEMLREMFNHTKEIRASRERAKSPSSPSLSLNLVEIASGRSRSGKDKSSRRGNLRHPPRVD